VILMARLRSLRLWTIIVVCLGLLSGCAAVGPEPIQLTQPSPQPTETPAPLRVHMAGAVLEPGVYELPRDSRVIDGIEAAGGLHPEADADGVRVYIPFRGTSAPPEPTPVSGASRFAGALGMVNINLATTAELETLPGIGPALATRIVAHRETHGPFAAPEEIIQVSGIGDAIYANIKDRIVTD
jgi:competence protein ComEA